MGVGVSCDGSNIPWRVWCTLFGVLSMLTIDRLGSVTPRLERPLSQNERHMIGTNRCALLHPRCPIQWCDLLPFYRIFFHDSFNLWHRFTSWHWKLWYGYLIPRPPCPGSCGMKHSSGQRRATMKSRSLHRLGMKIYIGIYYHYIFDREGGEGRSGVGPGPTPSRLL